MCQEEQFQQSALLVMVIMYCRQERMRVFPIRHKLQRLALGAATRQEDGHMPDSFIADPKLFQALVS
jgi:hypothetical protein